MIYSFGVPLVFTVIGAFASRLGRRDGDNSPRRNHWAVGTSVILMSTATIIASMGASLAVGGKAGAGSSHTVAAPSSLPPAMDFVWLLGFLVLMWLSVDMDRFSSWVRDDEGKPTGKKSVLRGIVLQNAIAVGAFALYSTFS